MKKAILLIDHGSRKEEANRALEKVADMVAQLSDSKTIIQYAHMELSSPTIEDGYKACVQAGAEHITIMPYFLFEGRHASVDIPNMVAEVAKQYKSVTYCMAKPLGLHEALATIILDRCREADIKHE